MSYTKMDIGDNEFVVICNDCGASVVNGSKEGLVHYKTCQEGEAEKWEKYYEEANQEIEDESPFVDAT